MTKQAKKAPKAHKLTETQQEEKDDIRGGLADIVYDVGDHISNAQSCETLEDLHDNIEEALSTLEEAVALLQELRDRCEALKEEIENPEEEEEE